MLLIVSTIANKSMPNYIVPDKYERTCEHYVDNITSFLINTIKHPIKNKEHRNHIKITSSTTNTIIIILSNLVLHHHHYDI